MVKRCIRYGEVTASTAIAPPTTSTSTPYCHRRTPARNIMPSAAAIITAVAPKSGCTNNNTLSNPSIAIGLIKPHTVARTSSIRRTR